MQSNTATSRKAYGDAYFPVSDRLEIDDLMLADTDYNFDMIGVNKLHEKGLMGAGERIGIIDSGHKDPASIFRYKNFTGEIDKDLHGHGTHVHSIIRTITPFSEIWVAKAMNQSGGGQVKDLKDAAIWLIDGGCTYINCSFAFNSGIDVGDFIDVLKYGVERGVIFCCASGNEGADKVSFPSSYHDVFSVGAVDRFGLIASFSNRGADIDVVAPGKDIVGDGLNGRRVMMSGTSQATPHLTGMLALYGEHERLVYGKRPDFFTCYSDITKGSVKDLGNSGFDNAYGYGLIQPSFAGIGGQPVVKVGWLKKLFRSIFG